MKIVTVKVPLTCDAEGYEIYTQIFDTQEEAEDFVKKVTTAKNTSDMFEVLEEKPEQIESDYTIHENFSFTFPDEKDISIEDLPEPQQI